MKNGVPFDIAFSLPKAERLAFAAALGEWDGSRHYNWRTMGWEQ